ncbi:MAG: wax ester/triacylglycerol synthase domain-containing protein [Actinomycetes bacterium]
MDDVRGVVEPVSAQDSALWCATRADAALQVGALCRFEGGPLRDAGGGVRVAELRAHVASRLHLLPRFRQRLQRVPWDVARPVWVDDDRFDLDVHLRTATLDPPGDETSLRQFVAALLGGPLHPDRPLWELWSVDGLANGDVAVVLRAGHVLADGLSLLSTATALLDLTPQSEPSPPPVSWRARPTPRSTHLAAAAVAGRSRARIGMAVDAARLLTRPGAVARCAVELPGALVGVLGAGLRPRHRPAVTGVGGVARELHWASVPLAPLRDAAHAAGATLNDAVLAAVALTLGGAVGVQVLVPVGGSTRAGNDFSFVVATLPPASGLLPAEILAAVHTTMAGRKSSEQAAVLHALFQLVDVVPVPVLRRVVPPVLDHQPFVDAAVTDLPGSPIPLYLRGAKLIEMFPLVTGVGNVACVVGVLSYCDRLCVGLTVDPDVVRDANTLLDRLVEAAGRIAMVAPP